MGQIFYIYGLFDLTGCRYIGQTIDPIFRYYQHCTPCFLKTNTYKNRWLRKLIEDGVKPEFRILEETTEEQYQWRERAWISFGRHLGWKLTNGTDGGEGAYGCRHTEEQKQEKFKLIKSSRNIWEDNILIIIKKGIEKRIIVEPDIVEEAKKYLWCFIKVQYTMEYVITQNQVVFLNNLVLKSKKKQCYFKDNNNLNYMRENITYYKLGKGVDIIRSNNNHPKPGTARQMDKKFTSKRNKWSYNTLTITNRKGENCIVKLPQSKIIEAKKYLWRIQHVNGKTYVMTGYNNSMSNLLNTEYTISKENK